MTEFKCPDCGRVSHNPNDVLYRYCGACHRWWDEDGCATCVRGAHRWKFHPSRSDGGNYPTDPAIVCEECGAEYDEGT